MSDDNPKLRYEKALSYLKSELAAIRVGSASISLVEDIKVEAYEGSILSLRELAVLSTPQADQILIQPWDKSIIPKMETALRNSPHQFSPAVSEDVVRLTLPPLSEERRREAAHLVGEKCEEVRVSVRGIRREARDEIEEKATAGGIGEDDKFRQLKAVDELTKEVNEEIDRLGEEKRAEVLAI